LTAAKKIGDDYCKNSGLNSRREGFERKALGISTDSKLRAAENVTDCC